MSRTPAELSRVSGQVIEFDRKHLVEVEEKNGKEKYS